MGGEERRRCETNIEEGATKIMGKGAGGAHEDNNQITKDLAKRLGTGGRIYRFLNKCIAVPQWRGIFGLRVKKGPGKVFAKAVRAKIANRIG